VETLTVEEQAECMTKARECSFAALPPWNGAVGAARARTIYQGCLDEVMTTSEGKSCKTACTGEEAKPVCDSVIEALPFYADASAACLAELDSCLETCHSIGGDILDELWESPEAICWENGFNGTCDGYARGHKKCGGTYADDTHAECDALCKSTDGAWMDDLDTICTEQCN
jgi:hypothetical protein